MGSPPFLWSCDSGRRGFLLKSVAGWVWCGRSWQDSTEGYACLVVAAVFKTVVGLLWSWVGSIPSPSAIFTLGLF